MSSDRPKAPPKRWELWGSIFLIVVWLSNASAGNLEGLEGSDRIANDLILVGGIGWLISVIVRYKRAAGDR